MTLESYGITVRDVGYFVFFCTLSIPSYTVVSEISLSSISNHLGGLCIVLLYSKELVCVVPSEL